MSIDVHCFGTKSHQKTCILIKLEDSLPDPINDHSAFHYTQYQHLYFTMFTVCFEIYLSLDGPLKHICMTTRYRIPSLEGGFVFFVLYLCFVHEITFPDIYLCSLQWYGQCSVHNGAWSGTLEC